VAEERSQLGDGLKTKPPPVFWHPRYAAGCGRTAAEKNEKKPDMSKVGTAQSLARVWNSYSVPGCLPQSASFKVVELDFLTYFIVVVEP
jgi:hypothetical protein